MFFHFVLSQNLYFLKIVSFWFKMFAYVSPYGPVLWTGSPQGVLLAASPVPVPGGIQQPGLAGPGASAGVRARAVAPRAGCRVRRLHAGLKGSIGEEPNHSNFSHQSSVKILAKFNPVC